MRAIANVMRSPPLGIPINASVRQSCRPITFVVFINFAAKGTLLVIEDRD